MEPYNQVTQEALQASNESPIAVAAFSGGAASTSDVLSSNPTLLNDTIQLDYLEPGGLGLNETAVAANHEDTMLVLGSGFQNYFIQDGASTSLPEGITTLNSTAGHSITDLLNDPNVYQDVFDSLSDAPACKDPQVFTPTGHHSLGGGGGGGGGGNGGGSGGGGLRWLPTITWTLCNWDSSDGMHWFNTGCFSWTYIL